MRSRFIVKSQWLTKLEFHIITVRFPDKLADGREWSQVDVEGQAWCAVVRPNDSGGWTAECFDRLTWSYEGHGIPAFVPKQPQPVAPRPGLPA